MNRLLKHDIEQVISAVVVIVVITIFIVFVVGVVINGTNSISEGVLVGKYIDSITNQKAFRAKSYYFTIEGEKRSKTVRYTFEVTENEYETYKIGDWYER